MATADFSKFAGILSAALSQERLWSFKSIRVSEFFTKRKNNELMQTIKDSLEKKNMKAYKLL